MHWLWQEGTCLVYGGGDHCDFQELLEVANSEVADTDAPVKVGALYTGGVHGGGFGYLASPSFCACSKPFHIERKSPRGMWMRYISNFFNPS